MISAAITGSTAVAAYIDAKYHLTRDVRALYRIRQAEREYAKAGNFP